MEKRPETEVIDPVEKARLEYMDRKLREFFGDDYHQQTYPKVKATLGRMESVVIEYWSELDKLGQLIHSPDSDQTAEMLEDVKQSRLPKSFWVQGSQLPEPEGDVYRRDIVGLIDGAHITAKHRNLIGPKQLTFEEE